MKPFVNDLKVIGPEDRHDTFFQQVWEQTVGAAGVILRNPREQQVATKVHMEGKFKNPHLNTLDAVWEVLGNAFVQALVPTLDNEISINSVNTVLPEDKRNKVQKIFSPRKENGDKKNKENKF